MPIEIISKELTIGEETANIWSIFIQIDNGIDNYLLATTLPGSVAEANLQSELDAREPQLFAVAQDKGIVPDDIYTAAATRRVLKAFALVVLDEVNILRGLAVPPLLPRTTAQLRTAVKNKLQGL